MQLFKKIFLFFLLLPLFFILTQIAVAQEKGTPRQPTERYFKGKILEIVKESEKGEAGGYTNFSQKLKVQITDGEEKGREIQMDYGGILRVTPQQKLTVGSEVIVLKTQNQDGKTAYSIMDRYRLNSIMLFIVIFFVVVILIAGRKGLGSILGLLFSLGVLLWFIVPQILAGNDPLTISIIGSFLIMVVTMYLAHGFSKRTSVALLSTCISLLLTGIFSVLFVRFAHLSGLGNENTYMLQFGQTAINLQGILLGGMIIGALGVLDDIATTQAATIFELSEANKKLQFLDLVKRGMNVGREHISSLVNTLVLAYAGVSLGLFILFVLNPANQPYWVILNSEVITEEVVRTIAGSLGLVLAVPITTLLAAFFCSYKIKFI